MTSGAPAVEPSPATEADHAPPEDARPVQVVAIVEACCHGLEHVPFNAALVAMTLEAFPAARVDVYGEVTHLAGVEELLNATRAEAARRVRWHALAVPERHATGRHRAVAVMQLFADLQRRFARRRPEHIVLATVEPYTLGAFKLKLWTAWTGLSAVAIFHEALATVAHRYLRSPLWWAFMSSIYTPHPKRLTYVVLSRTAKHLLDGLAPRLARRTVVIEHPSLMGDVPSHAPTVRHSTPRFGFMGFGRDAKGFATFLELAESVRARYPDATFEVVGSAPADATESDRALLLWSEQPLPLRDFTHRLRGLTHVIWLGRPEHYGLVVSGSLIDTLALGIPVVCLSGPFVDDLFVSFGEIGSRCATTADVEGEVLQILASFSEEDYSRHRRAMVTASLPLRPESSAHLLRAALVTPAGNGS